MAGSTCIDGRRMRAGPKKRSVMISGHATSLSIETVFWHALKQAAEEEGVPLSTLVAQIDAGRVALPEPANLASAIRVWLFERALAASRPTPGEAQA
jgi:predicted DNA-binding ribbon-helix-helix protein